MRTDGVTNGTDHRVLSARDLRRIEVMRRLLAGDCTAKEASRDLRVSQRHVRRLESRVRAEGESGLLHKLKGRASNRTYPESLRRKVLGIYAAHCRDLGMTAALRRIKKNRIRIHPQTLRRWLAQAGFSPSGAPRRAGHF